MGVVIILLAFLEIAVGIYSGLLALTGGGETQLIVAVLAVGFGISHIGIGYLIAMGADWMKLSRSGK